MNDNLKRLTIVYVPFSDFLAFVSRRNQIYLLDIHLEIRMNQLSRDLFLTIMYRHKFKCMYEPKTTFAPAHLHDDVRYRFDKDTGLKVHYLDLMPFLMRNIRPLTMTILYVFKF